MTIMTPVPVAYQEWMAQAACRGHDPDLWYPEDGDENRKKQALRICATCPVRSQCLEWAFVTDDRFGILGGQTKIQRTVIRNKMKRLGRWTRFISQGMTGRIPSAESQ